MNAAVPLINLTTNNRTIIAYACSHIVMIYNYETKKAIMLQGHEHAVKTLSASRNGKWLLSADFEDDHVVVVWDTETGLALSCNLNCRGSTVMFWEYTYVYFHLGPNFSSVPISTLFNPHAEHCLTAARISPNAKYIVTVGNERFQKVQIWLWTFGLDEPHASLELTEASADRVKEISFNEDLSEEFILTGESNVVFVTWEDPALKCYYTQGVDKTRGYGILNCSCIVPNIQRAYTATSNGYVLVWQEISEKERSKNKEKMTHIKSIRLQQFSINVILHYHGFIVVGTAEGRVSFYDLQLKLIYFIHNFGMNSVRSISFKIPSTLMAPKTRDGEFIIYINYHCLVTGNARGMLSLYEYEKHKLLVRKAAPPAPDFQQLLERQVKTDNITYVTCPQSRDKSSAISVLKYSPLGKRFLHYGTKIDSLYTGDQLACGLNSGILWILHPITLDPLHEFPYKHSTGSIIKLVFTDCAEYMAYYDNTSVVAVFQRNHDTFIKHPWNFLGKYRTHLAMITDILFGPATSINATPRLFSLGEDRKLVEYDLKNSGPYPDPGLRISEIYQIEHSAVPLCLAWYPNVGFEQFLIISNSEYKYRLLNDVTKMIRGTYLGPIFGAPVQRCEVLSSKEFKRNKYVIFATDKEVGLQILPFDGNPYKTLGIIGHPRKVIKKCICVLNVTLELTKYPVSSLKTTSSVDVLEQLGGQGLSPYYCLLEGGRKGWLINEMKDFFYYAQILHQGEYTPSVRIVTEKVTTKQIPNLMRAIGFYPTNEDIEILMNEVSYRNYAETGKLTEEITFEDFVKYYINHRPAFGISLRQLLESFQALVNPDRNSFLDEENPVLTRNQFLNVLFGKGPVETPQHRSKDFGEPLVPQEAYMYLKRLVGGDDNEDEADKNKEKRSALEKLKFLPERISYKDFITDIMGIELPEEMRADDE
ncbi:cilia- and flagella-associated protein 251 [Lasioglossum baleicum]|uniref:cilia- and flagella-associated protein 251 n=1 Tax=Lasioglossum baleicum TaxID=434251 RepID=UPI003FCC687A